MEQSPIISPQRDVPTAAERDDLIRRDLGREFRARLRGDSPLVLLGHGALIVLVAALIWNDERRVRLAWWMGIVLLTTIVRTAWLWRVSRPAASDRSVFAGTRAASAMQGLAWSCGAALLIPALPLADAAIILVVIAGIGAGALATLAPDAPSFYIFLAALSLPLPIGLVAAGVDRPHVVAGAVVLVLAGVLLFLYRRAHAALITEVRSAVERARAESALRESDARYSGLFEHMREGLAYCRMSFVDGKPVDFVYLAVNAAFERLTSLRNVVGRKVSDVIPGIRESDPQLFEVYGRVASGGSDERFETYVNALEQWLSISVFSPQDGHFVAVFEDITARKRTEEELRRSEQRYRSLVDHAAFGMYRSTLGGRLLSANAALVTMLGYDSEEEMQGLHLGRDVYADPTERERTISRYQRAERIDGVEVVWKRKDGGPITVKLSGRPTHDQDGTLNGFEMAVENVTARRVLEDQLRQAQKMEAVGALAGGVAHDFNNLLTAVLASGHLLDESLPPTSPLRDDVATICKAAQRGAELTQKLLAYSRRRTLDLRPISLEAVSSAFVSLARRLVPENIEIVFEGDPGDSTVRADPGAVEQILMNLVTNARDAMPDGGKMEIVVGRQALDEAHRFAYGWDKPGPCVYVVVSDTGVGMDREIQSRVFEPFYTTKGIGKGTGLGLSVVYGLVKQHDGFVTIHSEVGQGTTVRVFFPAARADAAEPDLPAVQEIPGGTETILVVEDDAAVRRAAIRVLEKFGYRVLGATDGQEAMEILESCERPPDLILSDVIMPNATGPQLLRKLRERGAVPKVLFTSGYTGREAADQAQLESGVPMLVKPWAVPDLLRMVREVLDGPAPG